MANEKRIRVGDLVTIYPRGKKRIWTADFWWDGNHCRKTLRTRRLRRARQLAIHLENRLQQGLNPFEMLVRMKVSLQQATDDFLSYQRTEKKRKKTHVKYKGLFKKFVGFANTQSIEATREMDLSLIDKFRDFRRPQIGDRSMHNDGVMLKTFFGWCVERQLMANNPLGNRKFRRPRYEPRGGPTLAQVDAVLAIAPPSLMPIIAIAAFAGRRSGEYQHLLSVDVDFPGNWIHVISRPGAETKSGNSRKVPIHPRLRKILEKSPKSKSKWFFTAAAKPAIPGRWASFEYARHQRAVSGAT